MFLKNKKFLTRGATLLALAAFSFSFVGCDFFSRSLPTGIEIPQGGGQPGGNQPRPITVTFNFNGGTMYKTGSTGPRTVSGNTLQTFDMPLITKTGHQFTGWRFENGAILNQWQTHFDNTVPQESFEVTAQFSPQEGINIIIDPDDGFLNHQTRPVLQWMSANSNWDFTFYPFPLRSDRFFAGYLIGSEQFALTDMVPTDRGDLVVFPNWATTGVTITIDGNGGEVTLPSALSNQIKVAAGIQIRPANFVWRGAVGGTVWQIASFKILQTGEIIPAMQNNAGTLYTATTDVTLVAQWGEAWTVRFFVSEEAYNNHSGLPNDWTGINTESTVIKGQPMRGGIWMAAPDGYVFAGWQIAGTSTVLTYEQMQDYIPTGNIDLFPVFVSATTEITITLNLNDGVHTPGNDWTDELTRTVTVGTNIVLTAPTRDGFTFMGWLRGNGTSVLWYNNWFTVVADETFTAQWAPGVVAYTVTFDAAGGVVSPASVQFAPGDFVFSDLPVPTREGFWFFGWQHPDGTKNIGVGQSFRAVEDVTLVAEWHLDGAGGGRSITLDPNGGNVDWTYNWGPHYRNVSLPIPTLDGFTFVGWHNEATDETTGNAWWGGQVQVLTNIVLKARWEAVE